MVGGWGGVPKLVFMDSEKSRWFSWIVRSETDCHGREHGNNFGVKQHQTRAQKKRERTAEQPRKP